jgi:hypothetical protein
MKIRFAFGIDLGSINRKESLFFDLGDIRNRFAGVTRLYFDRISLIVIKYLLLNFYRRLRDSLFFD